MRIACVYLDERKGIFMITVDEEEWRKAHRSILGSKPSFPEECGTLRELEEHYKKLECSGAHRYALMRLGMKSHSTSELRRQLQLKFVSEEMIEQIIEDYTKKGYLNDQEWLDSFIRIHIARNTGPQVMMTKLRLKGLPSVLIEEAFERAGLRANQQMQIKKLLSTRYRSRNLEDGKERQKVIAALVRKGFDFHSIFEALRIINDSEIS